MGWRNEAVLLRGFDPAAEDFRDAPCLGDAASRRVGRVGVEDLADGADAGLVEMRDESSEKPAGGGGLVGM